VVYKFAIMKFQKTKRKIQATWWSTIDKPLFVCFMILIILGILLVMAASPVVAKRIHVSSFHFVYRQLFYIVIGFSTLVWLSTLKIITARRLSILGFLGFFILLVLVEFMGFETKGSKRWVYLGPISIQPTEVLKPFFAILIAWLLTRKYKEDKFPGFTYSFIVCAIVCLFIIRQPDFSMVINMVAIWFTQMMVAGFSMVIVIFIGLLGVLGLVLGYFYLDVVKLRVDAFIGKGGSDNFQTDQSLQAFKSGGIFGVGPGQGKVKEHIPDCHTDFIFPVAGEELGLIACLVIIGIFAYITIRGYIKLTQEKDLFVITSVSGLLMIIFFQAAINMGVAVNLFPNTGMTLPFVSYGGSSMISICITAGLILCMFRKRYD